MHRFGPFCFSTTRALAQPRLIAYLKLDRDSQRFCNESGVTALFMRNQTVEHFRVGTQAASSPIPTQHPPRARRNRRIIEPAAHQHGRAVHSQAVCNSTIHQFPELLDAFAWPFVLTWL